MYGYHRCRCEECRGANRDYFRQTSHLTRRHEWVDGDLVRDRIKVLRSAGMPMTAIAEAIDLPAGHLSSIVNGVRGRTVAKVHASTYEKLMTLSYRDVIHRPLTPRTPVDGASTAVRIKALLSLGWSTTALEEALGISKASLNSVMSGSRTNAKNRDTVHRAFDRLRQTPPPAANDLERMRIKLAKTRAQANRWTPAIIHEAAA